MWDIVPWPGIELGPPALGVWDLSLWTTTEAPWCAYNVRNSFLACRLKIFSCFKVLFSLSIFFRTLHVMWNKNSLLINTHTQKKTSKSKNRYFYKFKKNSFSVFQNVCPRNMQVIFTVLKVVLRGPFFPQLESILVVKRLLSHPKAMAELEQTWQDMPTCSKAQSCLALCQPMDCSPPGSSVYGISQQEYWSALHFLFQGIFPTQGSNLRLLCLLHWQANSLPTLTPGKFPGKTWNRKWRHLDSHFKAFFMRHFPINYTANKIRISLLGNKYTW